MISKSAEYAIRSLAYLAGTRDRWVMSREMGQQLGLPPPFLTKLLGALVREELLLSQRGKTGGFRLARAPEEVTLLAIVDPFDRISGRQRCLLGQDVCSDTHSCPLHESWRAIQREFLELFAETTLAAVVSTTAPGSFPRPALDWLAGAEFRPSIPARARARTVPAAKKAARRSAPARKKGSTARRG